MSSATIWEGQSGTIPVVNTAGQIFEEIQVATAAQTVFTLTSFQYTPGTHSIFVYRKTGAAAGGEYLRRAVDFTETSTTVVTLAAGATVGDLLIFQAIAINLVTPAYATNGVPPAGTTGQILAKASGSDYDLMWTSPGSITTLLDAARQNVASASTVNLSTIELITRNVQITGTTQIDGFQITSGQLWVLKFAAALILKNNANIATQSGYDIRVSPGDTCFIRATGANVVEVIAFSPAAISLARNHNDFRLTMSSGIPVPIVDVTTNVIFCTPYKGNKISLFNGVSWVVRQPAEFSIVLAGLTVGRPYDVFCYDNAGTPTLEILIWTSTTTRATLLTTQDGVLVKNGDATRKYMGTFVPTAVNAATDSARQRLVWNYYNRVRRNMLRIDATASWVYTLAALHQANASATNQLEVAVGVQEGNIDVYLSTTFSNTGAAGTAEAIIGIGEDSTVAAIGECVSGRTFNFLAATRQSLAAKLNKQPSPGYRLYTWLESSTPAGVTTWIGSTSSGISASWSC